MARKQQRFAAMMTYVLQEQGASAETAILAPQIALACYKAGREFASGDPAALWPSVSAAFDRLGVERASLHDAGDDAMVTGTPVDPRQHS